MVLEHMFSLTEMMAALCILAYLNNKKFSLNIRSIVLLTLDMLCLSAINELQLSGFFVGFIYVFLFIYSGLEYGFLLRKMIINMILMSLIISACQAIAMSLVALPFKDKTLSEQKFFAANLCVMLVVVFLLKRLQIHRISIFLQQQEWIVFFVLLMIGVLIFLYIFSFKQTKELDIVESAIFFVVLLYVCLMTVAWKYYKNVAVEKSIEMRTARMYSQAYKNMIEDVCSKQHDFDNHLSAILSQHYTCEDYDSLVERQRNYIQTVQKNNKYNRLLWAGDSILVGFLYGKCLEAEKKGITVDYHLRASKLECVIPDYQVISILGNLFDNAMEAVEQMELKIIRFLIEEQEDALLLEIANPYVHVDRSEIAKMFKQKYSKKGEHRGYGLYNVKKICDQHNIEIRCEERLDEETSWLTFWMVIKK